MEPKGFLNKKKKSIALWDAMKLTLMAYPYCKSKWRGKLYFKSFNN